MRPQYHFRDSPQGLRAWSVRRLIELSRGLIPEQVPLTIIRELDEPFWNGGKEHPLICGEIAEHARLISESDLSFPIILSSDGRVMDGMHRVCKALNLGMETIAAVRFTHDPDPDYIGVHPNDLPYDE
jgi:hypothetical protein